MMTKNLLFILIAANCVYYTAQAQDGAKNGFQKEKLFTGGSISLGYSSNSFQVGGSPFLGYSLADWADAGITINYNYTSFRNIYISDPNDKIRKTNYGGGAFTRLYPVRFLFAQAQFEHNFITQKFIPGNGHPAVKTRADANSLLLGAGYSTDRYPDSGRPFFYLSILFDVLNNEFSPYTSSTGNIVPIIRAGIQVPLFQGNSRQFK